MGSLIETKGTQRLARLFNSERFDSTNIVTMRGIVGLTTAFGSNSDQRSLLSISDQFRNKWTGGADALYPSATVTTVQAVIAANRLTFTQRLPTVVQNGMSIHNETQPGIPRHTTISNLQNTAGGPWTVDTNNPVTASAGDTIVFSYAPHPNLIKRWRYYLQNELDPANHSLIQNAIFTALNDPSYTHIRFTVLEDATQRVISQRAYNTNNATDDNIDPQHQHMHIILFTKATNAPDPLDPQ